MEDKRAVFDIDCACTPNGCTCLPESQELSYSETMQEPILLIQNNEKCKCNDLEMARRISSVVSKFLSKKFQSKRWLKSIFRKKLHCASTMTRIKTRVVLLCNPHPNDILQASAFKKYSRRERL